jgi:hypothetical protein
MESLNGLSARSIQYLAIAKKWSSDLEFYKLEIKFLRSLLGANFITLQNNGDKETVKRINNDLVLIDGEKTQLECLLDDQIKQLELMAEDVIPEDVTTIAGKQIRLEYMVSDLFSEYKDLKREIFDLVQEVSAQGKQIGQLTCLN